MDRNNQTSTNEDQEKKKRMELEEQKRINVIFKEILEKMETVRKDVESGKLKPSGYKGVLN